MPDSLLKFCRKYAPLLTGLALVVLLCLMLGIVSGRTDRYVIHAHYDDLAHTLTVRQSVHLKNRTGLALDHLYFNLFPNAYASPDTLPVPRSERACACPAGFSPGGAEITALRIAGKDVRWHLEGAQKTLLRAVLPFALRPGGSTEVEMEYIVTLPENRLRMGYSDEDVRIGNTFATLCVHDGESFCTDGYSAIGDPFLSACADWEVTLTAPPAYTAAGAGLQEAQDGLWRFRVRNARDFALFLSKDWHAASTEHNGVLLRSFAFDPEDAQEALTFAAQAVDVFSALFGPYPYEDLTVCAAQFSFGGMEYPALALADRALYESDDGMLELVVAHETAHQWWYAAVGSDPIRFPWQDEALAEYSTLLYYETVYGPRSFDSLYQSMIRPATESASLRGVGVGQGIDKFESTAVYDALIYRKGAAMLHDLRVHMGNDAFFAALKRYYERNRFRIAAPEDLFLALDAESAALMQRWLLGSAP